MRQYTDIILGLGFALLALLLLVAVLALGGCREGSSVKGGESQHQAGTMTITYGGATITDTRETRSTSQPSVETYGPGVVNSGGTGEDPWGIGSLNIDVKQLKARNTAGSIAVASMFIFIGVGIGLAFWFTGNKLAAIVVGVVSVSGAGLAFLYPVILGGVFVFVVIASIGYLVWCVYQKARKSDREADEKRKADMALRQVVKSVDESLKLVKEKSPELEDEVKVVMSGVQDRTTKDAVAIARTSRPVTVVATPAEAT